MRERLFAALLLLALATSASARLQVVATLPELALLVEAVGGERVSVEALASGEQDPHVLGAKPSHSRRLMRADLLVSNGLELEVGWLPLLIQGARNPELRAGRRGHLDLSTAIEPIEVPVHVDRSHGDVHPKGNPHYTLDPGLYPDLAETLAARMAELDPEGAAYYAERLAAFRTDWETRLAEWTRRLAPLHGLSIVTYHKQWEYFALRFGLEIVDYLEDRPGIPPSPRHVAKLERRIGTERIPLLIYSDLVHPEPPERLARRAGCHALALPQAPGSREGNESLVDWFDALTATLAAGRGE